MRELKPAKLSDRKKTIAKNCPPLMLPNNKGILEKKTIMEFMTTQQNDAIQQLDSLTK